MIKMDKKDTTRLCFICEKELVGNGIQLDSRRTYIGNELLTQKIAGIAGDDIVISVKNEDRSCPDCVALLNDIDMLEMDLKLVKNSLLSAIKNKYGLSIDADDEMMPIMVENGVLKGDRSRVSNPLKLKQVEEPIQFLNIQHQEVPTPPKVLMPQVPGQLLKNYMPIHSNKIEAAKCNIQNISGIFPVLEPQQVFKCKICVKYFTKREVCLHHIQEYHDEPASIVMEIKPCNPTPSEYTPQPKLQLNNQNLNLPRMTKKEVTEEKEDAAEPQ